jgi:hypothetical protein
METDNDESAMNFRGISDEFQRFFRFSLANFGESDTCELRRTPLMRTSEKPDKAKFAFLHISEAQLPNILLHQGLSAPS